MRTRVKICGITSIEDARLALSAGADSLGFNMYPGSPRFVDVEKAREILSQLPPLVVSVGLFVNETAEKVNEVRRRAGFNLLQFHGDESDEYCRQFEMPYVKVIRVKQDQSITDAIDRYPGSRGILLDAFVEDIFGGTGQVIDWSKLPMLKQNIVLAGGLNPDNVSQAIAIVNPYAVDVSSGVELSKGKKDANKIYSFFAAVAAADRRKVRDE